MDSTSSPERRLRPRIRDTDWLVLKGLTRHLRTALALHAKPQSRVLDFGCGTMPYRQLVEEANGHYLGADFGAGADVEITPEGNLAQASASTDIVLSVQVLEHVRDLDRYFSEIHRILQEDGTLILSTHGTWLYHPHPEDHRRWTRTGLLHEIESRGFTVSTCEAIVGPLAWTTLVRLTGYSYALRKFPAIGSLASALLAVVMNVRAVVEDRITPSDIRDHNACVYLVTARKTEPVP